MGRAVLAVAAVVALAWLGVMERDVRLLARATSLSARLTTGDDVACARSRTARGSCTDFGAALAAFRGAGLLNPATAPELSRGLLEGAGHWRRLAAACEAVLRREPDNLAAWSTLALVTRGHDPGTVHRAGVALHRLDPLDFPSE